MVENVKDKSFVEHLRQTISKKQQLAQADFLLSFQIHPSFVLRLFDIDFADCQTNKTTRKRIHRLNNK